MAAVTKLCCGLARAVLHGVTRPIQIRSTTQASSTLGVVNLISKFSSLGFKSLPVIQKTTALPVLPGSSIGQGERYASLAQMWRLGKPHKVRKSKPITDGKPFLKGVILKTIIKKPKKPNSANRKCVRVKLSSGREVTAYIPGEGHNLQEHNIVLVRGGKVQDLPGVKHKCVRGKYDLSHVKK